MDRDVNFNKILRFLNISNLFESSDLSFIYRVLYLNADFTIDEISQFCNSLIEINHSFDIEITTKNDSFICNKTISLLDIILESEYAGEVIPSLNSKFYPHSKIFQYYLNDMSRFKLLDFIKSRLYDEMTFNNSDSDSFENIGSSSEESEGTQLRPIIARKLSQLENHDAHKGEEALYIPNKYFKKKPLSSKDAIHALPNTQDQTNDSHKITKSCEKNKERTSSQCAYNNIYKSLIIRKQSGILTIIYRITNDLNFFQYIAEYVKTSLATALILPGAFENRSREQNLPNYPYLVCEIIAFNDVYSCLLSPSPQKFTKPFDFSHRVEKPQINRKSKYIVLNRKNVVLSTKLILKTISCKICLDHNLDPLENVTGTDKYFRDFSSVNYVYRRIENMKNRISYFFEIYKIEECEFLCGGKSIRYFPVDINHQCQNKNRNMAYNQSFLSDHADIPKVDSSKYHGGMFLIFIPTIEYQHAYILDQDIRAIDFSDLYSFKKSNIAVLVYIKYASNCSHEKYNCTHQKDADYVPIFLDSQHKSPNLCSQPSLEHEIRFIKNLTASSLDCDPNTQRAVNRILHSQTKINKNKIGDEKDPQIISNRCFTRISNREKEDEVSMGSSELATFEFSSPKRASSSTRFQVKSDNKTGYIHKIREVEDCYHSFIKLLIKAVNIFSNSLKINKILKFIPIEQHSKIQLNEWTFACLLKFSVEPDRFMVFENYNKRIGKCLMKKIEKDQVFRENTIKYIKSQGIINNIIFASAVFANYFDHSSELNDVTVKNNNSKINFSIIPFKYLYHFNNRNLKQLLQKRIFEHAFSLETFIYSITKNSKYTMTQISQIKSDEYDQKEIFTLYFVLKANLWGFGSFEDFSLQNEEKKQGLKESSETKKCESIEFFKFSSPNVLDLKTAKRVVNESINRTFEHVSEGKPLINKLQKLPNFINKLKYPVFISRLLFPVQNYETDQPKTKFMKNLSFCINNVSTNLELNFDDTKTAQYLCQLKQNISLIGKYDRSKNKYDRNSTANFLNNSSSKYRENSELYGEKIRDHNILIDRGEEFSKKLRISDSCGINSLETSIPSHQTSISSNLQLDMCQNCTEYEYRPSPIEQEGEISDHLSNHPVESDLTFFPPIVDLEYFTLTENHLILKNTGLVYPRIHPFDVYTLFLPDVLTILANFSNDAEFLLYLLDQDLEFFMFDKLHLDCILSFIETSKSYSYLKKKLTSRYFKLIQKHGLNLDCNWLFSLVNFLDFSSSLMNIHIKLETGFYGLSTDEIVVLFYLFVFLNVPIDYFLNLIDSMSLWDSLIDISFVKIYIADHLLFVKSCTLFVKGFVFVYHSFFEIEKIIKQVKSRTDDHHLISKKNAKLYRFKKKDESVKSDMGSENSESEIGVDFTSLITRETHNCSCHPAKSSTVTDQNLKSKLSYYNLDACKYNSSARIKAIIDHLNVHIKNANMVDVLKMKSSSCLYFVFFLNNNLASNLGHVRLLYSKCSQNLKIFDYLIENPTAALPKFYENFLKIHMFDNQYSTIFLSRRVVPCIQNIIGSLTSDKNRSKVESEYEDLCEKSIEGAKKVNDLDSNLISTKSSSNKQSAIKSKNQSKVITNKKLLDVLIHGIESDKDVHTILRNPATDKTINILESVINTEYHPAIDQIQKTLIVPGLVRNTDNPPAIDPIKIASDNNINNGKIYAHSVKCGCTPFIEIFIRFFNERCFIDAFLQVEDIFCGLEFYNFVLSHFCLKIKSLKLKNGLDVLLQNILRHSKDFNLDVSIKNLRAPNEDS